MPVLETTVKEHRQQVGLSQEALARQLGVSRQTTVNIERGTSEPRVLLALAIAAVLGSLSCWRTPALADVRPRILSGG